MEPNVAFPDSLKSGIGYDVFKTYLKRLSWLLFFLGGLFLAQVAQAQTRYTHDFSTPAVLSGQTPSWPWNITATISIGGVDYELSQGGNGSWENRGNGGANGSASLYYNTAADSYVTIKRKDNQRFKFYGLWMSYDCLSDATYYPPPHLTITYTGSSLPQEIFNDRNRQGLVLSKDVEVSSVTFYFSGLHTLNLDNLVVGSIGAPLSNNANLSNLTLSGTTLSPAFSANTVNYTASVANTVSSVTVTPTKADANATVSINGTALASGVTSRTVNLNVGANTITTVVTAQNGSTKTYTVTVTRAAAPVPATPSVPDLSSASDTGLSNNDNITNDNTPTFVGTATPGYTVTLYSGVSVVGTATADGAGNWSITTTTLADGAHTMTARAVGGTGSQSPASAALTVVIDTTAPNTTITAGPAATTNATSATITFTSSETVSTFQASVDGSPFTTATTPLTLTGLSEGSHTVLIRAMDVAGNLDPTPASYTWQVDTTAPVVTNITRYNPATATTNASAVTYLVSFSKSVTGVTTDDFTLVGTGMATGTIASVSGSGERYEVAVSGISGSGTLRLNMNLSGTGIKDIVGNGLSGGYTSGQVYTVATTPLTASITSIYAVSCNGGANGQATVTASGGLAPYTYSWSPGGRTQATATGLTAGTYTVTVTDAMGQTASAVATVTQPTALQASTSATDVSRRGGTDGAATVVVTGGRAPYTYSWSPSGGTGATASGLPAGTYTVVVTDANSCTLTRVLTISEPANTAPVAVNDSYSVNKGQTLAVPYPGLLANDSDAEGSPLTATLVSGVAHGTLTLNADGSFTYIHDGSASTSDAFTYRVSDGSAISNTATVTISVITPPTTVASINLLDRSPTNANSLRFAVTFATAVSGVDASDFTLVTTGTAVGTIASVTGSGTTYTVQVNSITGDGTLRLDFTGLNGVTPNISAAYTSGEAYTIDTTSPVITSVSVPANATYSAGQLLNFTVNFSEAVTVATNDGIPTLGLTIGTFTRLASYVHGSGTSSLNFHLIVQPGDLDMNGITIGALALNGGTITDAIGNAAVLTLYSVSSTAGVLVDAVAPSLQTVTIASSNSDATKAKVGDVVTLRLEASEPIAQPVVTVAGKTATVTAVTGTTYTATYTLTAADAEGTVPFTINFSDLAGNSGTAVSATTNNSSVTFDKTAPAGTLAINGGAAYTSSTAVTLSVSATDALTGVASMRFSNDNTTWSAWMPFDASHAWTLPAGNGTRQVYAQLRDGAGNIGMAQDQIIVDNVPFTLTLSSGVGPATNASFEVTFTFSKAATGFSLADLTVVNATASSLMTADNKIYKATITPASEGEIRISVAAGVAVDVAGNLNAASNTISTLYDTTRPVVTLASAAPSLVRAPFEVSFTFSEQVTGFTLADIAVVNGTASDLVKAGDKVYTARITPDQEGEVIVAVLADAAQDAAGNSSMASLELKRTFDSTRPTLLLATTAANPTNAPFDVTFTFSEEVGGFDLTDISVLNGTASNLVATDGLRYSARITPAANGEVTVSVAADKAQDAASNQNLASNVLKITFDTAKPTLLLTSTAPAVVNAPFNVRFAFSKDVTGFAIGDIALTNGAAADFAVVDARTYTVRVIPAAEGEVTVAVAANAAQDGAGNGSAASNLLTRQYDTTRPAVVVSTSASSPVNNAITVTFEFSENVAGFAATGIAVTNGTLSQFNQVDGRRYSALVTPAAAGEVTVQVPANAAEDAATNGNLPSNTLAVVYDADRPAVVLASTAPNPINRSFQVSVTFTEPVTGFTAQDMTVANATLSGLTTADNQHYTLEVSPLSDGLATISVPANVAQDAAGNGNTASAVLSRTFNATRPTLALSTTATSPTNAAFDVSFTFSKEVSGFEVADIAVSNGAAAAFTQVSAQVYTARITPTAEGEVSVNVTENVAQDAAGNGNTAATALKLNIDKTQPSVVLASGAPEKLNAAFEVEVTFSETVTGFTATDVTVVNGTVTAFAAKGDKEYTLQITPQANGEVRVALAAGVAQDAAANLNLASEQLIRLYDTTRPAVLVATAVTSPVNTAFTARFTFSESVESFELNKITVENGSVSNLIKESATVYTALVTPAANGVVTVSVAENVTQDAFGNGNLASNKLQLSYDVSQPVLVLSTTAADVVKAPFEVTFTFSKAVTGFEVQDITVTNGAASAFTQVSAQVYTALVTPVSDGEVGIAVAADVARDAAGNGNQKANALTRMYDATKPTLVLSTEADSPTNAAFEVVFTFSEPVSGFALADIAVAGGTVSNLVPTEAGKVYTATITPSAEGEVSVSVAADVAEDTAGNGNLASNTLRLQYDKTRPAVTLATTAPALTNAAIPVTITFSEPVTGFALADFTITNGTAADLNKISETRYSALVTLAADGAVSIAIADNKVADAATNGNTASNKLTLTYDGTAPAGYAIAWSAARVDVSNLEDMALLLTSAEPGTTYTYRITSGQESTEVTGKAEVTEESLRIENLDLDKLQDGTLTVQLYLTDKAGNKGAEVTAQVVKITRNIASVATPAIIQVPIRTKFEQVPLPATVEVTYSTGETAQVKVRWEAGAYNGLIAGPYVLTGILELAEMTTNLDNLTAKVTVEVQPNKVPTALAFSATTFKPDATAADVIGTLATTDPDDTEFVYTLVSGDGDAHNALFEIRGDQVYLKSNNGLSGMTSFTIRVRSTDPYLNTIERTFTLTKQAYDRTVDQLKIVNAFSPNGDGINDNWTIPELRFYNEVYIQVFDRSGVRVFETTDPEKGWDGRGPNGQILKGAFLFTVEVKDINWVKRGVVTILSK